MQQRILRRNQAANAESKQICSSDVILDRQGCNKFFDGVTLVTCAQKFFIG